MDGQVVATKAKVSIFQKILGNRGIPDEAVAVAAVKAALAAPRASAS